MNLKKRRKVRRVSQVELSAITGISRGRIHEIEKGTSAPKPAEVEKLENALSKIPELQLTFKFESSGND